MLSITHQERPRVVVGVDTHKDFHVAAVRDVLGRRLGHRQFPAEVAGYQHLRAWAQELGEIEAFGIEGTGAYGAGLTRWLRTAGERVVEVSRPNRQHRARHGKSDAADADAAAGAVLAGDELGAPKSADGTVEAIRVLRATRASAVRAKTNAVVAMGNVVVTAPDELRASFAGVSSKRLVRICAAMTAPAVPVTPTDAAIVALVALACRYQMLDAQAKALEKQISVLVRSLCPQLLEVFGVGPDIAATLLVAIGDNGGRLRSEATFAKICGVAPRDASSGRQVRHRLNRGGNRKANSALHTLVVVRLRAHQPTRDDLARRLAEGKTKKEVMRCLKRYAARELYTTLRNSPHPAREPSMAA